MGVPIYLAIYWRAKLRAKAAAEAEGKVMGKARKALFSPPIDNGTDAVGEAVGTTTGGGSTMCWPLFPKVLLVLIPVIPVFPVIPVIPVTPVIPVIPGFPYGYGCFCWPHSTAGTADGAAGGTAVGAGATGLGELEVEGESRCLSKLTRWWRRHFARLLENQTWLINR